MRNSVASLKGGSRSFLSQCEKSCYEEYEDLSGNIASISSMIIMTGVSAFLALSNISLTFLRNREKYFQRNFLRKPFGFTNKVTKERTGLNENIAHSELTCTSLCKQGFSNSWRLRKY